MIVRKSAEGPAGPVDCWPRRCSCLSDTITESMPRRPRRSTAGFLFHVMNRGARRLSLFDCPNDFIAFVEVLREATDRVPMRLLCYVVMPNHWHLVLWPQAGTELSVFMAWMTATHARRWHLAHRSVGNGTIYQGRFRAIAVKDDHHFLTVCRYVERNPVRARLVTRAEDWKWSSASRPPFPGGPRLDPWPVPRPANWDDQVNAADSVPDLIRLRDAICRGTPYGPDSWREATADRLGWRTGMAPRGRPPSRHCRS
jgi:putative transposase